MIFIYPRNLGILGWYYKLLCQLSWEDSWCFVTLFHPNPLAHHCPVASKCKPGDADARRRRGEPPPAVINEWPLPTDPQGVSLEWHEQFPATLPLPQGGTLWAADLTQNHLWQPCDSSVTATRLLGGPVCSRMSQKESIFGSTSMGTGGGKQKVLRLADFWCRNLNPEHQTQRIHSSIFYTT